MCAPERVSPLRCFEGRSNLLLGLNEPKQGSGEALQYEQAVTYLCLAFLTGTPEMTCLIPGDLTEGLVGTETSMQDVDAHSMCCFTGPGGGVHGNAGADGGAE